MEHAELELRKVPSDKWTERLFTRFVGGVKVEKLHKLIAIVAVRLPLVSYIRTL